MVSRTLAGHTLYQSGRCTPSVTCCQHSIPMPWPFCQGLCDICSHLPPTPSYEVYILSQLEGDLPGTTLTKYVQWCRWPLSHTATLSCPGRLAHLKGLYLWHLEATKASELTLRVVNKPDILETQPTWSMLLGHDLKHGVAFVLTSQRLEFQVVASKHICFGVLCSYPQLECICQVLALGSRKGHTNTKRLLGQSQLWMASTTTLLISLLSPRGPCSCCRLDDKRIKTNKNHWRLTKSCQFWGTEERQK